MIKLKDASLWKESALIDGQWLGADAEAIIPGAGKFARPKVIR